MGLLDIFLSPEKQLAWENRLLAKPNHAVAEVSAYNEYDREERIDGPDGSSEWRTVREATVSFQFTAEGKTHEVHLGPSEGYTGFRVGQQIIVRYRGQGIVWFGPELRRDSPNRR